MAGVAGLQQANNINGCDTSGQLSSPANTAGNPAECRTFETIAERERIADLRQIHSRINRMRERLAELRERIEFHEHDGLAKRLDSLEKARAWIDTFEVKQVADALNAAIDGLNRRVVHIRGMTEHQQEAIKSVISAAKDHQAVIATLTEAVQQLQADAIDRNERELNAAHEAMAAKRNHPDLPDCGNPDCGQCYDQRPAKRTIKGGWMNVYLTRWNTPSRVGALCSTKEEADRASLGDDHRIACIQIPDITEGEGL